MSIWQQLISLIDSHNVGDTVRRKEIMKIAGNYLAISSTLDNYRRTLVVAQYLRHSHRGEYELIKKIEGKSYTQVKQEAEEILEKIRLGEKLGIT